MSDTADDGHGVHDDARTYPDTGARPHTGDRVRVDSSKTVRFSEDVTGRVRGTRKKVCHERKVDVFVTRGTHPVPLSAVTLLEASTPRFDGYDPESDE